MIPSVTTNETGGATTCFTMTQGETAVTTFTVSSGDAPVNLTGYTCKMLIAFPTPRLLTTDNGGITLTDATQGAVQINIADTVSAGFPVGSYNYDFWMISGGGVATKLLSGQLIVQEGITPIP